MSAGIVRLPYIGLSPLARGTREHGKQRRGTRAAGLSPLARGTLDQAGEHKIHIEPAFDRFIPAGAGNTNMGSAVNEIKTVYPRWRGEHEAINSGNCCRFIPGLSPLARGTLTNPEIGDAVYPRWRGEHTSRNSVILWAAVYPRWRGEHYGTAQRFTVMPVYPRWRGEHSKHNLLLINDFLSQSQSTNFIVSHKQHIHYVKEYLIH